MQSASKKHFDSYYTTVDANVANHEIAILSKPPVNCYRYYVMSCNSNVFKNIYSRYFSNIVIFYELINDKFTMFI